jgi:hypothetical protein
LVRSAAHHNETETTVSDTPHSFDTSIPVLTDVVTPGKPALARSIAEATQDSVPVLTDVIAEGKAFGASPAGTKHEADLIAERLRGRFTSFLTGDGRELIETRCREALQEHSTWLVHQVTREVALALETEMTEWVREAVEEELVRRTAA